MVPEDSEVARLLRIIGKVQGVWYRGWTCDEAMQRSLRGWVRNWRDGSVEAFFAGPPDPASEMIRACVAGPLAARVDSVEAEVAELPSGPGFLQLPTE